MKFVYFLFAVVMWSGATWIVYNGTSEGAHAGAVIMLGVGAVVALVVAIPEFFDDSGNE